MRIIRRASLPITPWRNGGGVTQEVIRVPAGQEAFTWRLSVAEIHAPGPFSDFSGYQRNMLLLKGAGIKLKFLGMHEQVLQRIGELFEFDGSLRVDCELLDGPCTDLNLISSHAIGSVGAQVHHLGRPLLMPESLGETLLLVCVSGTVVVEDARGELEIMESWDTVICPPSDASVACRSATHSPAPALLFTARIAES